MAGWAAYAVKQRVWEQALLLVFCSYKQHHLSPLSLKTKKQTIHMATFQNERANKVIKSKSHVIKLLSFWYLK
jgi:hypothetical protein